MKTQASMWGAWEERIGRDSTRRGCLGLVAVGGPEYSQRNRETCDRKQASLQLDHRLTGAEEVGVIEELVQEEPSRGSDAGKVCCCFQHPGSSF